jgi:cell fate regulator YaaT (PSP1 superfamily)
VIANGHYLIRYGRPGFVGRFASELPLARGDRAIVRGPRGIEFGEVLVATEVAASFDGAVLRHATSADDAESERLERRGQELLASAGSTTLPLAFVDVEVTLDRTAILHALAWDACDATPLLDELAARFGLVVRLLDLSRAPVAKDPSGCGKPGCGSEGGGCSSCGDGACSTGSCSRGAVKSPEELTAYFADLRRQMEDAGLVRTPLN